MGGARLVTPLPGAGLLAAIDIGAREAAVTIGQQEAEVVKELIRSEPDSRGFIGRYDLGTAHDAVRALPVAKTPGGYRAEVVMDGRVPKIVQRVLEDGRRPGKRPPPTSVILPWVERKLGDVVAKTLKGARVSVTRRAALAARRAVARRNLKSGKWTATEARAHERGGFAGAVVGVSGDDRSKALRSVAFLIARSIGRKGTPGLKMFAKAAKIMRPRARRIVALAMRRAFTARTAAGMRR